MSKPITTVERAILVDHGEYWWYYDHAIVDTMDDGSLEIRAKEGHPPIIIPKPGRAS